MKAKKLFSFKLFIALGVSFVLLNSCGGVDTPEQVVENLKQELTEMQSGNVSVDVSMKGADGSESIDFNANVDAMFDRHEVGNQMADVKVVVKGNMLTEAQTFDGDVDLSIKTVGDDYYVYIDKFESSDESIQAVQPFLSSYLGKWLHVASDFIPENIRELQQQDEAVIAKEAQLKELFINTNLFDVIKDYGVENLNGKKVYHYGVKLNEGGIKDYVRKAAIIDGRELTDAEVEEAAKVAGQVSNAELWIGSKDFQLYKAVATLSDNNSEGPTMSIDFVYEGSDYNKKMKIDAPTDAQEFNPLELLMGYGAAAVSEDVEMEEEFMDEMMEIE